MGRHPLDISHILSARGVVAEEPSQAEIPSAVKAPEAAGQVRIRPALWQRLNEESRRILTSRVWRGVDFNPFLENLDDLTTLTEEWLRWAIPAYVNGRESGPIAEWLSGRERSRSFHHVLVGEHLKHARQLREERKAARRPAGLPQSAELSGSLARLEAEILRLEDFINHRASGLRCAS